MVALSVERRDLPHAAAGARMLTVAVLTALWFALVYRVPEVGATVNGIGFIRIAIHVVILTGLWHGLRLAAFPPQERTRLWLMIAVPLTIWLATIWYLAMAGVFRPSPPLPGQRPLPLLPVAILLPPIVASWLLLRSRRIGALLDATPAQWLVGLQVYRVFGGMFLVNWARGLIPGEFALPAGIGDVAVGVLALPAALYVATGTMWGRRLGIAWNVLGLLDFASAISTGFMTSPGPFQLLALDHPNTLVGTYPTVMIPGFSVPTSIVLHILSIWQLVRIGRQSTTAVPSSR
jgi:hypothetical protein